MKLENVVGLSFLFVAVFCLVVLLSNEQLALFLFSVSPLVIIYLVWRTLRDPHEPTETFEEQFYQDRMEKRAK